MINSTLSQILQCHLQPLTSQLIRINWIHSGLERTAAKIKIILMIAKYPADRLKKIKNVNVKRIQKIKASSEAICGINL
jgi:hypothetical protein